MPAIPLAAILLLITATLLGATPVQNATPGDSSSRIRLTYSVFFPSTHVHTKLAREWAAKVEEATGGRVVIDVYPGGILSGASENYECVVKGVSDLGMSCFSYSRGMFPLIEGLDLPLGYRSGRHATRIANQYFRHFMPAELGETEIMYLHAHGPGVLATRRNVNTFSDFAGLSVRGTGISALIIKALGGNPIGMGQPDTYEALRKGVVEGTLCPIETLKGWRQGEVISQVVRIPSAGYTTAMFVAMNRDTWRRLPPDIQEIIRQINDQWIPKHGAAWDEADQAGEEFVLSLGKSLHRFSPAEDQLAAARLEPLLQNWADSLEKRGLPGNAALAFLRQAIQEEAEAPLMALPQAPPQPPPAQLSPWHPKLFITVMALTVLAGLFTIFGGNAQRRFWECYRRFTGVLSLILAALSGIALLSIIVITLVDVVGRRLGAPLHGAIDLIQLLACLSCAAALPYITAVKGHIAVEFFFQRLPPRQRVFWDTLNRICVIVFFTYLAQTCFAHGNRLLAKNAVALSLGIPLFWILWVMGVSFVLALTVVLYNLTHPGQEMLRP